MTSPLSKKPKPTDHGGRVLIFSTSYFPFVGGAEVAVQEITKRCPSYTFELITARYDRTLPTTEQVGNVRVYRLGLGNSFDKFLLPLLGTIKTFSLMWRGRIDLFWGIMVTFASGIPYIVNILRFWNPVPIVLTIQEGDSEEHIAHKQFGAVGMIWKLLMLPVVWMLPKSGANEKGMIALAWRLALPRTHSVTAISSYLAGRIRQYGYDGELHVIPNGVDVNFFSQAPSPDELENLRHQLNKKSSERYIITVSRLVTKNAVDDLIRALTYLPKQYKLIIAGTGDDGEALWELVQDLKVSKRTLFVGHVPHEALRSYLALADVFIRPSLSEGFGNVFVEAMAARLPVIATPVGGILDFLVDPVRSKHATEKPTGLLCNVRDPEDIARQVERLFKYPKLRERITHNAYTMVKEKYDWNTIAQDMREKVFKKHLHFE